MEYSMRTDRRTRLLLCIQFLQRTHNLFLQQRANLLCAQSGVRACNSYVTVLDRCWIKVKHTKGFDHTVYWTLLLHVSVLQLRCCNMVLCLLPAFMFRTLDLFFALSTFMFIVIPEDYVLIWLLLPEHPFGWILHQLGWATWSDIYGQWNMCYSR